MLGRTAPYGWRVASMTSAILVLLLATSTLVAWSRGLDRLIRFLPGYSPQVPITAVCLGLLAACVLVSLYPNRAVRILVPVVAVLVALIAFILFAEYVFDRSFGIESLLFPDRVNSVLDDFPGRPSVWTSVAIMLLATAIAMIRSQHRVAGIVSGIALILAIVVVELVIVAYLFDAQQIISVFGTKPMSLPTCLALILLAVAAIAARPDRPPLGATALGAHVVLLAWMLPFAVLVPILEWTLEHTSKALGLDEAAAGVVGRVAVAVSVGALVVWLAEARRRANQSLASERLVTRERERFRAAFQTAPSGLFIAADTGAIEDANQAFADLVGRERSALIGQKWQSLPQPQVSEVERRALTGALGPDEVGYRLDRRVLRPDGTEIWVDLAVSAVQDDTGGATTYVGVVSDVGDRKRQERNLIDAATHDPLTGLANRRVLESWMTSWRRMPAPAMTLVVFADIDEFKNVNDTISHAAGDTLLRDVAQRLASVTRIDDLLVRLGGDEFVIAATVADDTAADTLISRVREALHGIARLDGRDRAIHVSLGWAVAEDDVRAALRLADKRMYADKATRKSPRPTH